MLTSRQVLKYQGSTKLFLDPFVDAAMHRLPLIFVVMFSFCLMGLSGCLLTHSNHTVIRQGEPLQPVAFETDKARHDFELHVEREIRESSGGAHSSFAIPFIVGLEKSTKKSENAIRNDTRVRYDTNGDGFISEFEVSPN